MHQVVCFSLALRYDSGKRELHRVLDLSRSHACVAEYHEYHFGISDFEHKFLLNQRGPQPPFMLPQSWPIRWACCASR